MTPRSRLPRAGALMLCGLLLGAACESGVSVGPKLAKDQVLRVQLEDEPASLDPGQSQYTYETAVLRAVSEPLLKPRPNLTGVEPAAAESYESNAAGTAFV